MRPHSLLLILVTLVLALPLNAAAQNGPFLFTLTPLATVESPAYVHYDAAYGSEPFEPVGADGVEQNLGLRVSLGETFALDARAGVAFGKKAARTLQQAELIARVATSERLGADVLASAGMRHEYGGTNVLLGRLALGRVFTAWQVYGNLLLEKPLASGRDNIDLITTVGMSYHLSTVFRVGLEAVGQDLEGFWDPNEAEGGALLYAGPVIGVNIPATPWTITLGGGAILRATRSNRTSDAVRGLPVGNGFVIRSVVSLVL